MDDILFESVSNSNLNMFTIIYVKIVFNAPVIILETIIAITFTLKLLQQERTCNQTLIPPKPNKKEIK